MSKPWVTKFIVLRPDKDQSSMAEVFRTDDFQKARYWLQYIAKPNDVLCATPLHPKHGESTKPVYKSHKVASGETATNEDKWKAEFGSLAVPESQQSDRDFS